MTELERICLKQNATELRRIATIMNSLEDAPRDPSTGLPVVGFLYPQVSIQEEIDDLKDRLNDVVRNMKNLQTILNQPLKSK